LSDGREYPARVLRNDDRADLAVLRIDSGRELPYLPLWGAGPAILGETVIAIGNPYGLENSVTTGIISAIGRELKLPNGETFTDLIQTDASINPGNSGGPLLNINGDLLGINVAIRSNAQGIGFTIPTERVRRIVERLMGDQTSTIVQHGLYVEEVRMPANGAGSAESIVRVAQVQSDSEAFKQGFREGDELLRIARQQVRLRFDIERIFWDRELSEPLEVQVKRAGRMVDLKLTLKRPNESESLWQTLGVMVEKVPPERVRPVYEALNGGLLLLKVAPGSPAAAAGFRAGDILIGLHEYETIETGNVRYIMQLPDLAKIQPIEYHLIRDSRIVRGRFALPALKPVQAVRQDIPTKKTG
jgi:serine protease Do